MIKSENSLSLKVIVDILDVLHNQDFRDFQNAVFELKKILRDYPGFADVPISEFDRNIENKIKTYAVLLSMFLRKEFPTDAIETLEEDIKYFPNKK
jgi:hypothetical protein